MALDELFEKVNQEKISRRGILKAGVIAGIGIAGASIAGCTNPTPKTKDTLKVGYLITDHDAPLYVGVDNGYFAQNGLKLELTSFQGGAAIMQQIIGGNLDIGLAGIVPVISAVVKDPTIKVVAAVHNNGSGLIVKKGSTIDSIAKLKGKKIAIPLAGSIQDVMVRLLLKRNNLDYDKDVTVTTVPAPNMLQALESGSIDAYMAWEPFITQAEHQNVGQVLLRFEEIMPNHPCDTIVTTTKMIDDYPDSVKAFLKAHKEAVKFIRADKDKAAEIVGAQKWTKVGTDVEKDAMEHMTFMYIPNSDFIEGSETFAREMKSLGLITKDVTSDDIFDLTLLNQI